MEIADINWAPVHVNVINVVIMTGVITAVVTLTGYVIDRYVVKKK